MTPSLLLDNLLAWSAQVFILVAVAAIGGLALRQPRARLFYWQAILALALLLPLIQPWSDSMIVETGGVTVSMSPVRIAGGSAPHTFFTWQREYFLLVIAAGAGLRLLWIALGFLRLRRHRLAASTMDHPPVPFERDHVRWYISDTVSGPVTFGWLRPSILLPSRILELPADLREAIACHELVHVERGDWLFVLAEELIRAVCWFHPALWFVLSRVQLAREQTVDREVIDLTRNRERYLDALVAVAQHKLQPDLAPAPLFLKKRQLAVRVAAVLKETRMSKPRLIASFTTVFSAALVAARLAVWFFPMEAPAQSTSDAARFAGLDGPGITVDPGAPLMHRTPVSRGFSSASGTVVMEASLSAKGDVSDARVISGPEELRKPALQSVLQWHYSTISSVPPTVQVTIKFDPLASAPQRAVMLASPSAPLPSTIKQIQFSGTTPEIEQQVRQRLTVREGDPIASDSLARILAAAREVDEHFTVGVTTSNGTDGHRESSIRLSLGFAPAPGVGTVAPSAATTAPPRIRVGGNVQQANLIVKVTPSYPPAAKQARVQGIVSFTAIIGKDGSIQNLDLISGDPMLADTALEAVKQWIYKPTLLNGNPVEVITQIDVNFTLSQ
jgi:TonB family protein